MSAISANARPSFVYVLFIYHHLKHKWLHSNPCRDNDNDLLIITGKNAPITPIRSASYADHNLVPYCDCNFLGITICARLLPESAEISQCTLSDVTWASWCLKPPPITRLCVQQFVQTKIYGNTQAPNYWFSARGMGPWERVNHYSDVIMSAMASQFTGVSFVCPTVCPGADQIKHQSSAALHGLREGNPPVFHRSPVDSPHKVTRKCFHLMTFSCNAENVSKCWCHLGVIGRPVIRTLTLPTKSGQDSFGAAIVSCKTNQILLTRMVHLPREKDHFLKAIWFIEPCITNTWNHWKS